MESIHRVLVGLLLGMIVVGGSDPERSRHSRSAASVEARPAAVTPLTIDRIEGVAVGQILGWNLDPSGSSRATTQLFPKAGGAAFQIERSHIDNLFSIYLQTELLPRAAFSARIDADRPVAAIAEANWYASGGRAKYGHALASNHLIVPVFSDFPLLGFGSEDGVLSSVVHIQNSDPRSRADIEMTLRDSQGTVLLRSSKTLLSGHPLQLDQGPSSPLLALPSGRHGSLEIRSNRPVAVASHIDDISASRAVMSFEVPPVSLHSHSTFAPLVANADYKTWMVVTNPHDRPEDASLTIRRNTGATGDACGAADPIQEQTFEIKPRQQLIIPQASGHETTLPKGCSASAMLRSESPLASIILVSRSGQNTGGAYTALTMDDASTRVALPLVANRFNGLTTSIQVLNPTDRPIDVHLDVIDRMPGADLSCSGCQVTLPAQSAQFWHPPDLDGWREYENVYGSAILSGTGPIQSLIIEHVERDSTDLAVYAGLPICSPIDGPAAHRCQPVAHLPWLGSDHNDWITTRLHHTRYLPITTH